MLARLEDCTDAGVKRRALLASSCVFKLAREKARGGGGVLRKGGYSKGERGVARGGIASWQSPAQQR